MSTSPVLGVPFLAAQQQQPEVLHNAALLLLQSTLYGVIDVTGTPPASPADGDTYIVGTSPTGAWLARENCIACYYGGWRFLPDRSDDGSILTPSAQHEGMRVFNKAAGTTFRWSGSAWVAEVTSAATLHPLRNVSSGMDFSSSSYACKGVLIVPTADIKLAGLGAFLYEEASATFSFDVYELDGSNVITHIRASKSFATAAARAAYRQGMFASAFTLTAGTRYALCCRRTDGADSYAMQLLSNTTLKSFYDVEGSPLLDSYARIAAAVPTVGGTMEVSASGAYALDLFVN